MTIRHDIAVKRQSGFSLVAAIFVLVVLALLGAFMVTMSVIERSTSSYAVQGARAYHAALNGIEWGVGRAIKDNVCPNGNLTIDGFSVTVVCVSSSSHLEPQSNGINPFDVFVIRATASSGSLATSDYFSRSAQVSVTNANPP